MLQKNRSGRKILVQSIDFDENLYYNIILIHNGFSRRFFGKSTAERRGKTAEKYVCTAIKATSCKERCMNFVHITALYESCINGTDGGNKLRSD